MRKEPAGTKKVGFIGPGKVWFSLGRHIAINGGDCFTVCGYYGHNNAEARKAAAFACGLAFDSAEELASDCDLLLLTVPDNQIADVWASLTGKIQERRSPLFIGHCSGSQGSGVFSPKSPGCHFGSMHPLIAVYDKKSSYQKFPGAYFTIEGDEAFRALAGELLATLKNPFAHIETAHKARYHAASVMISNLVCALAYQGIETYKACGLDEEFAGNAWRSLFLENAKNIALLGPVEALTGPVERLDTETIERHLQTLSGDEREIYLLLSRILTETARQKNPSRNYSELDTILKRD